MKQIIFLFLLIPMTTMAIGHVERFYNPENNAFSVRFDGQTMTIAEYDDWLFANYPAEYWKDTVLQYWMKTHREVYSYSTSKNYEEFTFATRTTKWGEFILRAWVIVDEKGVESSQWSFAGGHGWRGGGFCMYAEECDNKTMAIAYGWGGDTCGYTYGKVDEYGNIFRWTYQDHEYPMPEYIPWDWSMLHYCK